jgi:hypothetical protein
VAGQPDVPPQRKKIRIREKVEAARIPPAYLALATNPLVRSSNRLLPVNAICYRPKPMPKQVTLSQPERACICLNNSLFML